MVRDAPPTLPPTQHITLPDEVYSAAFAPGSTSIYIHQHAPSIDLWPLIIRQWPEALIALLLILTFITAILITRIIRRPQVRAAPHCRRCNYNLSGLTGIAPAAKHRFTIKPETRCPECGRALMRYSPRSGQTYARRFTPILTFYFITSAAAILALALLPREGRASFWLDLSSSRLATWANKHEIDWLTNRATTTDRILEVDLDTGKPLRTVATRRTRSLAHVAISPDGRALFLPGGRNTIHALSTRTGRRIASTDLPGPAREGRFILRAEPDSLLVQWSSRSFAQSGVSHWNYRRGTVQTLATTAAYEYDVPGFYRPVQAHAYFLVGGQESLYFVTLPTVAEQRTTGRAPFRIYTHDQEHPRELEPPMSLSASSVDPPAMSPTGSSLFIGSRDGSTIIEIDVKTGKFSQFASIPRAYRANYLTLNTDGSTLAVYLSGRTTFAQLFSPPSILLLSIPDAEPIAYLELPPGLHSPTLSFSPDSRYLAARGSRDHPDGSFTRELAIWKLPNP